MCLLGSILLQATKISVVVHDELDEDENKGSMKDILIYP